MGEWSERNLRRANAPWRRALRRRMWFLTAHGRLRHRLVRELNRGLRRG